MISDTDWAYAAGLLDGEGCILIAKQRQGVKQFFYYKVSIRITQNEYGMCILQWLKDTFGGCLCVCNKQSPKYKIPTYNWFISNSTSRPFLEGIHPYLKLKRAQAELALEFLNQTNRKKSSRRTRNIALIQAEEILHKRMSDFNQHKILI